MGESYVPMLDLEVQPKQPVTVDVEVLAAYPNKDTGSEGQDLTAQG